MATMARRIEGRDAVLRALARDTRGGWCGMMTISLLPTCAEAASPSSCASRAKTCREAPCIRRPGGLHAEVCFGEAALPVKISGVVSSRRMLLDVGVVDPPGPPPARSTNRRVARRTASSARHDRSYLRMRCSADVRVTCGGRRSWYAGHHVTA